MKISIKKLFKNRKISKLEKWKDTNVKVSPKGITIGKKLYKKPQDLKKPSLQIYNDISKELNKINKDLYNSFEEMANKIRKDLENKVSKELLDQYDSQYSSIAADLHRLTVSNLSIGWKYLEQDLKKEWKDFDKHKEKDTNQGDQKGRAISIRIFEEAKDINSQIWKDINNGKVENKDFCAVTSSLRALVSTPSEAQATIDNSTREVEKRVKQLEKISQELLEKSVKDNFRSQISAKNLKEQKRKIEERTGKKVAKVKERNKTKVKGKMDNSFNDIKEIIVDPLEKLLTEAKNNLKKVDLPEKNEKKVDEIVNQFEILLKETKKNLKNI